MKTSTIYVSLCVLGVVTLGTLLFSSGNIYSIPTADPFTSSLATPRLHFLLPATHSTPDFCKTLLTTLLHDYSPIIINWGNSEREAKGRLVKIAGVEEYIKNNVSDPNDLILMIDAFDVWVQHPPEVLLAKYAAFPPHVLIGADKKCWPDIPACYHLPNSTLPSHIFGPETDTGKDRPGVASTFHFNRPRFPNSGTILSPQSLLLPLYTSLLDTGAPNPHDDQHLFISEYANENLSPEADSTIRVDFTSDLFQVATFSMGDLIFMRGPTHLEDLPVAGAGEQRMIWNEVTGVLPSVLHFNGGEKMLLKKWWPRMWWITGGEGSTEERETVRWWVKEKVRRGGVTDAKNGRWIGWEELGCDADEEIWG